MNEKRVNWVINCIETALQNTPNLCLSVNSDEQKRAMFITASKREISAVIAA